MDALDLIVAHVRAHIVQFEPEPDIRALRLLLLEMEVIRARGTVYLNSIRPDPRFSPVRS